MTIDASLACASERAPVQGGDEIPGPVIDPLGAGIAERLGADAAGAQADAGKPGSLGGSGIPHGVADDDGTPGADALRRARKSVEEGKRGADSGDLGGRRQNKK